MYHHLLLHYQSSFPSALLYHQSRNYLPYNPSFLCCHHRAAMRCCATTTAPMLAVSATVLPPSCPHCHCHHAAATATTIPLPPPSCCGRRFLYCKISLIMKKNSVTMQTLIAFDFLNYSDLALNSCMGGCVQYSTL